MSEAFAGYIPVMSVTLSCMDELDNGAKIVRGHSVKFRPS